jgi:hypothetical protein
MSPEGVPDCVDTNPFDAQPDSTRKRKALLLAALLVGAGSVGLHAQTIDDAITVPGRTIFGGFIYSHDSWDHYWEGPLKRVNGNLGTVSTMTSTLTAVYGVTDRLNVFANIPFVSTNASQGVLASQHGWQDITFAAKYRIINRRVTKLGSISVLGAVFGGFPLTDYSPDFQPLSIGLGSRRVGGRVTVNYQTRHGWYLNGTTAYTWRGAVTLDRPYYFTDNQLFFTDQVQMPDVVDYSISPGYLKKGRMFQFTFTKQITEGGGDIRRQDAPFVSNRFIFAKIGGQVMYPLPLPKIKSLSVRFELNHVVDGRNVGQSNTIVIGLLETLSLKRR